MIEAIAQAITNRFNTTRALNTKLTGGLYFQQAPQTASSPYGVFYIDGIEFEEIMGTATDNITQAAIQFNLFSDANDGGKEVADLANQLDSCFNWKMIEIENYKYVKMQRDNILPLGFIDEVWQVTEHYSLWIQRE